jgi:hypothetical protein
LGFGDANGLLPATVIASNRQVTTYFRHAFFIPDPKAVQSLMARVQRDDAFVIYLNGAELWRDTNIAATAITSTNLALTSLNNAEESDWLTNAVNPACLQPGWNVLAAEVHQNSLTSSDLCFDFELAGRAVIQETPRLALSPSVQWLEWSPAGSYLSLYMTTNLASPIWTRLTNAPLFTNGQWRIQLNPPVGQSLFYRLQAP